MFRALIVFVLVLTACGDHVDSGAPSGASPSRIASDPSAKPTPMATPSPLPTAPTVAFPDKLSFVVGTYDGLVYSQLVNGKPAGAPARASDGRVGSLASYGRKVLVVCRDTTSRLALFD